MLMNLLFGVAQAQRDRRTADGIRHGIPRRSAEEPDKLRPFGYPEPRHPVFGGAFLNSDNAADAVGREL